MVDPCRGGTGRPERLISCVALVMAVPGGTREILADLLAACSISRSPRERRDRVALGDPQTAKLMGQFLPGTHFVTSGYCVMPRYDNTFGGGNYDADDIDEWLTLQRDWQVDGGIEPLAEEEVLQIRERAAGPFRPSSRSWAFPR